MDIRIPREAWEAGARALLLAETPVAMEWNYSISAVREEYLDKARACFIAMIGKWPEAMVGNFPEDDKVRVELILPLMEKPDGE